MSIFLMGCYDPSSQKWCTVTKCSGGHDDATLARLQKELDMVKISKVRRGPRGPRVWSVRVHGRRVLLGRGGGVRPPRSPVPTLWELGPVTPPHSPVPEGGSESGLGSGTAQDGVSSPPGPQQDPQLAEGQQDLLP